MIDIHSHILPGVDDGARTLTDSVDLVKELVESGATAIVATPHYVSETRYVSPKRENLKLFEELKRVISDEGINVDLFLGNEIYIDRSIEQLIKIGKIVPMASSDYLLVEFPLNESFPNYRDILMDLVKNGYKVILAHPERYAIVQKDFSLLQDLSDIGVLFQCNLGSIIGKYGREAKKILKKMAKNRMIFAFGSDIHHCRGAEYWISAQKKLSKYYSEEDLKRVLITNPKKMINR
ncbi:exopolysaccharide biosynthesis protein [Candidatus Saccharibacteria bacterium]|nr:exopolysaccharide biosynthesis protein [Candidatus Saccharibacteria bacterium]